MDKIRAAAVYNAEGRICGTFIFGEDECVKYILDPNKGGRGLLAELAPNLIGISEKMYDAIFNQFLRGMHWSFSGIYEYDLESFRKTFDNIIDEINKSVNDTLSQKEP